MCLLTSMGPLHSGFQQSLADVENHPGKEGCGHNEAQPSEKSKGHLFSACCAWGDGYQHLCSGRDVKAGRGVEGFGGTEKAQCALMEAVGLGNWLEVGCPVCLLGALVWFSLAGPKSEAG